MFRRGEKGSDAARNVHTRREMTATTGRTIRCRTQFPASEAAEVFVDCVAVRRARTQAGSAEAR